MSYKQYEKHGSRHTRLYNIWHGMKQRCFNPNDPNYKYYGGRGAVVCDEWLSFVSFKEWAESNGYDDTLSIDRIDPTSDYCPQNCRWIPLSENSRRAGKRSNYQHDNVHVKLTEQNVKEIVVFFTEHRFSLGKIAEAYGVTEGAIRKILKQELKDDYKTYLEKTRANPQSGLKGRYLDCV